MSTTRLLPSLALSLCVALLGGACKSKPEGLREWRASDHSQEPGAANAPTEAEPDEDPLLAARGVFLTVCANCHGRSGAGDGPQAAMARPPNFRTPEFQASRTDEQLLNSLRVGKNLMPAFGTTLRPEALQALVGLVREFGRPAPSLAPAPAAAPAPTTALEAAGDAGGSPDTGP